MGNYISKEDVNLFKNYHNLSKEIKVTNSKDVVVISKSKSQRGQET